MPGINSLPVQRPIQIWTGGMAEFALKRAARLGDAWLPLPAPLEEIPPRLERLREYARDAGRDLGAAHLSVNVSGLGIATPQVQIETLRAVKELLG